MPTVSARETSCPVTPTEKAALPRAASLTHLHILAVVNTRLAEIAHDRRDITICDVGCGNGSLLSYLASCLPLLWPEHRFFFEGMDVSDSGVQAEGFFDATVANLAAAHPEIDWSKRLRIVGSKEPWPFEDGSVDIITSNQVLEHVFGHEHFMTESYRVLSSGGVGIHLFPLRHVLWEDHVKVPLVHKVRQHDLIRAYLKGFSRIGLGVLKQHQAAYGHTIEYSAEEHADFLTFMVNYKSGREILDHCKAAGLRSTYAHTFEFYMTLVRRVLGMKPVYRYRKRGFAFSLLTYLFCRYLSSVTLISEKKQIYSR